MTRLQLALVLASLLSALLLVRTQYESRMLFSALHRVQAEARRLEIEYESLQLERRAQATPLRVEKLAREQLQMRNPSPAITQYVDRAAASPSNAASAP